MVELIIDGQCAELKEGEKIKYTRQIGDVYNIANVVHSFTMPTVMPKSSINTRIMKMLGIVGDTSDVPYKRLPVSLNYHGASLVPAGWLNVKKTDRNGYHFNIVDGMFDLFKAIENKTLGKDLDLSVFSHDKNIETVIDSFTNQYYKYLIADYGGRVYGEFGGQPFINIDYLVPCFNVMRLFERVFANFGFTFDPANLSELNQLYITYPKDPASTVTYEDYAVFTKDLVVGEATQRADLRWVLLPNNMHWTSESITEGSTQMGMNAPGAMATEYIVPENGVYNFDAEIQGYAGLYQHATFNANGSTVTSLTQTFILILDVYVNGQLAYSLNGNEDTEDVATGNYSIFLQSGDIVRVVISSFPIELPPPRQGEVVYRYYSIDIHHHHTDFKISKSSQGAIDFADAFADFAVKDFIKECLWVTATTPIIEGNHVRFITLEERMRLAYAQRIDAERINEDYEPTGMAQLNRFRHKYHDEDRRDQDGVITVENKNLPDEKIIAQSKIYAPEISATTFLNQAETVSFETMMYRIWNSEVKESSDGSVEVNYKGLNGRFYFIREKSSTSSTWGFGSETVGGSSETVVGSIPIGSNERTTYAQLVPDKWRGYNRIFNAFRAYEFEVAFGFADFMKFDLTKPIYINQEAAYFLPNKIIYQDGAKSKLEAIKINRPGSVFEPITVNVQVRSTVAHIIITVPQGNIVSALVYLDGSVTPASVSISGSTVRASLFGYNAVLSGFVIETDEGTTLTYEGPDVVFSETDQNLGTIKTVVSYG